MKCGSAGVGTLIVGIIVDKETDGKLGLENISTVPFSSEPSVGWRQFTC